MGFSPPAAKVDTNAPRAKKRAVDDGAASIASTWMRMDTLLYLLSTHVSAVTTTPGWSTS